MEENYYKTTDENPTYIAISSIGYITIRRTSNLFSVNVERRFDYRVINRPQIGPLEQITYEEFIESLDLVTASMVDILKTANNHLAEKQKIDYINANPYLLNIKK